MFKGDEKPAKEWECVLIYDEATQTFTLEKLDSLVNLNFDAKAPPRTRPAASRTCPCSPLSLPSCMPRPLPLVRCVSCTPYVLHALPTRMRTWAHTRITDAHADAARTQLPASPLLPPPKHRSAPRRAQPPMSSRPNSKAPAPA